MKCECSEKLKQLPTFGERTYTNLSVCVREGHFPSTFEQQGIYPMPRKTRYSRAYAPQERRNNASVVNIKDDAYLWTWQAYLSSAQQV